MSDKEDDLKIGVNSSAIFFGTYAADAVGVFFAGTAISLAYLAISMELNFLFWLSWGFAIGSWMWQYKRLKQKRIPKAVYGQVFGENVWLGFILLGGMVLGSLINN
jgi:4-hydroxybenzoate polyprenyltransferase